MTRDSEESSEKARKKWVPMMTVVIIGLHGVVFFLLAQCGVSGPSYRNEVSYIRLPKASEQKVSFEFKEPPERMFYQFASMPVWDDDKEPVPMMGARWRGYETLVALKAEGYSPIENYRLTMEFKRELRKLPLALPRARFVDYRPFQTVVIGGVPLQPVSPVPEPSAFLLFGVAVLSFSLRRGR
ncbi:MAG: PEP-CTERM sorting domain-containing protein [Roseibacillus sp.]